MQTQASLASSPVCQPAGAPACSCDSADHFVQFYDRDEALVRSVGDYALAQLERGARVLVIATADHRDGIAARLRAARADFDDVRANGSYIALDAAETLGRFSRSGRLDTDRFGDVIGSLVEKLCADGRPLAAFGEMVALLWAEGKGEQAQQLEELWNGLMQKKRFALFCAYPLAGFRGAGASDAFARICASHNRVLPTEAYAQVRGLTDDQLGKLALVEQRAAALEAELAEHRKTAEQLRQREAELTAFVETASIGLHWVNENGVIIWANRAELTLLGYSWEEYVGRDIVEFHVDRSVIDDILARLRRGERLRDYEAQMRCKDGGIKTVLIDSSVLWHEGRFVHTQCFTRDVTAQRESEQLTRHWAAIVESSEDAILSKDLHGTITSWNRSAERIFGYTREEAVGRPITMLIPPDRLDEEPAILARLERGERIEHHETVRRRKDGELIDVSLTISPVKDAQGRIVGASKIVRDITEKKRSEAALESARAEIATVNAALEQQVADLRQLQELSWKLAGSSDQSAMLHEVLEAALTVSRTDKGLLSLVVPERDGIAVAASRGFTRDFLQQIEYVPSGAGACGWCFHKRERVIVEDVIEDPLFARYRAAAKAAGFRAVHSTPLLTREGRFVGVLSVHFREPRRPSEREMRLLDLYARHAADLIDNLRLRSELHQELEARTAAVEQLRITNERFQLAAYGHTLTLFEQDSNLRYRWLYPAHIEHAGAIGRTDEEILGAESAAALTALKREVLATGLTRQAEVVAPLPSGTRYYDVTVSPKRNARGEIDGVAGAAFDITARKEAQAALSRAQEETAKMNRELEQRVQERTASLTDLLSQMETFSYAVSHDLRSPLRAMAGFAAVLREDHAPQLNEEGRQLLEKIIRASERMSRLINDVLAYARINRDRVELTPLSLSECLQHVIQHAPELQAPRADVIIRGHLPAVLGSEVFLTQVFANILSNAVKFVPSGRKPRVEISAEIQNTVVRVIVADNGIGVQPEHQARLFGLFERLNVDKRYEGTGMGLAIVRRALERMGGKISVESDGETGSRFIVELRSAVDAAVAATKQ